MQPIVFRRKFSFYVRLMARLMLLLMVAGLLDGHAADWLNSGEFHWTLGAPVLSAAKRSDDPCYSVKDPSVVYFEGRWHLFCTIRSVKRTHQIEYLSFDQWQNANAAPRHILTITNNYFCAPQVFYFTPHRKWYLIHQASDSTRKPSLQPAFSTTTNIAEPASWTKPLLLYKEHPENIKAWIDFWMICDDSKAHLFFTSNNGLMWRAETPLSEFPSGWSRPVIVLRGDIFEASHTYRLKGENKFLTIVEAQAASRRYYKAYLADKLEGDWKPFAVTKGKPFAGPVNVRETASHWTDSFSHGELLRAGYDEHLEINPANLHFLFQGVSDSAQDGKQYGQIPWQLGLLELEK
ncbi:MAG TPA: non-reducing end alpha-L-arabinofuranosidase family hydrolase [Verrucomicrobiae bacterium]|nr:non-reducing end alpha-L-arabinofuranosidase family hydrolase [Verrucomicrobiae bacterium]